jgi:hypothetical protein
MQKDAGKEEHAAGISPEQEQKPVPSEDYFGLSPLVLNDANCEPRAGRLIGTRQMRIR